MSVVKIVTMDESRLPNFDTSIATAMHHVVHGTDKRITRIKKE
jgi:hypothetical protein